MNYYKETYEIQTKTIKDLVEENKKLEKKLKVSISVRGKLLNKLSSLHRLVKNLEPTGDLMKQYQEFILTPKREHDAIKDEEMMKEGDQTPSFSSFKSLINVIKT